MFSYLPSLCCHLLILMGLHSPHCIFYLLLYVCISGFVTYLKDHCAGAAKGSTNPQREKVGKVTIDQLRQIAQEKMPDLNCTTIESAMRIVAGTAANMGIDVDPPLLEKKQKVLF